jgi:hypothetical protein
LRRSDFGDRGGEQREAVGRGPEFWSGDFYAVLTARRVSLQSLPGWHEVGQSVPHNQAVQTGSVSRAAA